MTQNRTFTIALIIIVMNLRGSYAQEVPGERQYHVGITIFDEHMAEPFGARKDGPAHLGGALSLEMSKKREGNYQFTHIFQTGYYHHKDFNQVAFLAWKPKFELRFEEMVNINAILGIGYAHSFPTRQTYRFDEGSYKRKTNWGKPHAMPSIGFGAGLHLDKLLHVPIELFARYEIFSLAPYTLKGSTPITLNTMTGLGIKYSFDQ